MRIYRPDSLGYLYEVAIKYGIDPREIFGINLTNCLPNSDNDPCWGSWTEIPHQLNRDVPSRIFFLDRLGLNERRLGNYLGYFLGPTYIENENNILINWNDTFRTKFSKVLQFGQRNFTAISEQAIPQVREFVSVLYTEQGIEDCIVFTVYVDEQLTTDDLCNLRIFPEGYELKLGHRLRPFEVVSYNSTTGELKLRFPTWIMVKPERYIFFNQPNAKTVTSIDGCDHDTYIDTIKLYKVSYDYPHGYVTLRRTLCNDCISNGVTLCDACTNIKLPFCVEPVDPENGEFKIKPLMFDEDTQRYISVDALSCCDWISTTLNDSCEECEGCASCCAKCREACDPCASRESLFVTYSYLSGCSNQYYKACCFEDELVCYPEAIYALALSELVTCDCAPCTTATIDTYSQPVWDVAGGIRTGIFTQMFDKPDFRFGYTFGAVEAATIIKDVEKRKEYVII